MCPIHGAVAPWQTLSPMQGHMSTPRNAPARLLPLRAVREVIADIMVKGRRGYMSREPFIRAGHHEPLALPDNEGLRASDFYSAIASLPDPAREPDAIHALAAVLRDRGHHFLAGQFSEEWTARFGDPYGRTMESESGPAPIPEPATIYPGAVVRRCRWCGSDLPEGTRLNVLYCSPSHRGKAADAKRRVSGSRLAGNGQKA